MPPLRLFLHSGAISKLHPSNPVLIYGKRIPRGNARFKAVSQPLPSIQRERRHLFLYVNNAVVRSQARPGSEVTQLAEPAQRQPNFGSLQLVSADEVFHANLFES
ncbi:MAG: hypothetical protein DMF06_17415, partial [Verrucomicrobia bacterium]